MKVDNLLGPYLYQYKTLSLPGIGMFSLAENAVLPEENAKVKMAIEGISFVEKTGARLDDSLVQFIKEQTGKMKPLAEADLYSYIATAFQYLNIGKPFNFEGIGTLQKNKDGGYTFTPGTVIPQKTEDIPHRHIESKRPSLHKSEDAAAGSGFNAGKLIIALVVLVTLGLVGWGGYYLYNKNAEGEKPVAKSETSAAPANDTLVTVAPVADTTGSHKDSTATAAVVKTDSVAAPVNGYKFIFETTTKKLRAAKRYEQLKGITVLKDFNNKVAMETKDSLSFNIYTIVPCTPADTNRVKDLLNAWYYGTKQMKVRIDH